ncbi:MAG: transrane transcriptional regulator [Pseudomonas sp.]|nr:transrane transcriptional regulator [Pseudomonas sp.]
MNDQRWQTTPCDELLIAYLDGELSAEERTRVETAISTDEVMAQRLEFLCRSDLPFQLAFDSVLDDAPTDQLHAMLAALPAPASVAPRSVSRRGFIAAAAGFVMAGVIADRLFLDWRTPTHGWRGLVAEYMALYTPQTLDNLSDDPASQQSQLAAVNERLGLALDSSLIALPRPAFKRAQILEYDGVPIAQITYLDPASGPLAFCITRSTSGTVPPATEERLGMNVVFWSDSTHAFMLIGHNPLDELEVMAQLVRARLTA